MIASVNRAATRVPAAPPAPVRTAEHCPAAQYAAFVDSLNLTPAYRRKRLRDRAVFVRRWSQLSEWFDEPLIQRLGRLPGEAQKSASFRVSLNAHPYLYYLALTDRLRLDYPFLLGVASLHVTEVAAVLGIDWATERLRRVGAEMGYAINRLPLMLNWIVPRIAMHTGINDVTRWSDEHLDALGEAIGDFQRQPTSSKRNPHHSSAIWPNHLYALRVILHHCGNDVALPRRLKPLRTTVNAGALSLRKPVNRWLAIKAVGWSPTTTAHQRVSLEHFLQHLASTAPDLKSFAELTPGHAASFVDALMHDVRPRTGRPLSIVARRARLSAVAAFLRDAAAWGWPDIPTQPLLDLSTLPRLPTRVPRFIPANELEKLMTAVRQLSCPFQRTALLTARWSGARRGEIARLTLECLDAYPDGTPRLRIPAGKTYRERLVPLHNEAAQALTALIAKRKAARDRPIVDARTASPVRYVFLRRGRPISTVYLFEKGLREACHAAGLVDAGGRHTITAHRFRHTVGTQLAERGAKISDAEVLRDYRSVLTPGAPLAGAGAEIVRAGRLSSSAVDWLQSNFFKTALELGHCLRLPSEGPCECDLYLSCAKFVTTPKYAPRLRERHQLELKLAQDARDRGWSREVERHCATARRIGDLLDDLGEPLTP